MMGDFELELEKQCVVLVQVTSWSMSTLGFCSPRWSLHCCGFVFVSLTKSSTSTHVAIASLDVPWIFVLYIAFLPSWILAWVRGTHIWQGESNMMQERRGWAGSNLHVTFACRETSLEFTVSSYKQHAPGYKMYLVLKGRKKKRSFFVVTEQHQHWSWVCPLFWSLWPLTHKYQAMNGQIAQ